MASLKAADVFTTETRVTLLGAEGDSGIQVPPVSGAATLRTFVLAMEWTRLQYPISTDNQLTWIMYICMYTRWNDHSSLVVLGRGVTR